MSVRSSYHGSVGGTMLPISSPRPAQQVSISASLSIAYRTACRTCSSSSGPLPLFIDSRTSPLVVPSITW